MKLIRGDEEFQAVLDELKCRRIESALISKDSWKFILGNKDGGYNGANIESLELLNESASMEVWAITWDILSEEFNYDVLYISKWDDPLIEKEVT